MSVATSEAYHFLAEGQQYPAFSFFFRLHSGTEKQLHDQGHIRARCREFIRAAGAPESAVQSIVRQAETLIDGVDYATGARSMSMFVSPGQSFIFQHFVNLPERYYLGDQFSGLEHLWAVQSSLPYLLLALGPSELDAYLGRGLHLETLASSPELDSLASHYRQRSYTRGEGAKRRGSPSPQWIGQLVQKVSALCAAIGKPLVLMGSEFFPDCTRHLTIEGVDLLIAVAGNHQGAPPDALMPVLESVLNRWRCESAASIIERCEAAQSSNNLASGPEEILECASAGWAAVLVLEEPHWATGPECQLGPQHEAIRQTLDKHGQVRFVPAGMLQRWDGAALILRY